MPEKFREWDVVNYLDSVRDACGYLEACLEEEPGDQSLLRLALSDIARAKEKGKFDLDIGKSDEELLQALAENGNLSYATELEMTVVVLLCGVAHNCLISSRDHTNNARHAGSLEGWAMPDFCRGMPTFRRISLDSVTQTLGYFGSIRLELGRPKFATARFERYSSKRIQRENST